MFHLQNGQEKGNKNGNPHFQTTWVVGMGHPQDPPRVNGVPWIIPWRGSHRSCWLPPVPPEGAKGSITWAVASWRMVRYHGDWQPNLGQKSKREWASLPSSMVHPLFFPCHPAILLLSLRPLQEKTWKHSSPTQEGTLAAKAQSYEFSNDIHDQRMKMLPQSCWD